MKTSPILHIERWLAAAACASAAAAWVVYARADLVLSHYDAKAHLVVARRVFDSITPGWQQIGAVWLPLPHLINVLPTQIDFFYRTGVFASLVSVICLGVTTWAAARLVLLMTGSSAAAIVAAAVLASNPNLLYLHATPMTEPLLLAATFLSVLWLYEWVTSGHDAVPWRLGLALFAATWTRYEAWPVLAAAVATATFAIWRITGSASVAARRACRLSVWPAIAVLVFLVDSRITVGAWFVTGGFYVPDPTYEGQLQRTVLGIWWGAHQLSGYVIEIVALAGAAIVALRALSTPARAASLIPISLFATAALPFYAFYQGHPYRIRYMIPMVAACALWSGIAAGMATRSGVRRALVVALAASMLVESPPWKTHPPMLDEAQWDVPSSHQRQAVTACLARDYRGEKVLASMGSLAHYMQELSRAGFRLADFVNEGNGVIWDTALQSGPAPHAGWMLVEEEAEGGDVLARRLRSDAAFADGMQRVCEGGGVALYRRVTDRIARRQ